MNLENLGAADRIVQTVLAFSDHMVHNRPGVVVRDAQRATGVLWAPVTHRLEDGKKIVYRLDRVGAKTVRVKLGVLLEHGQIKGDDGRIVGDYRRAGLLPEVSAWLYGQVADVWKLDNEFVARWASYAFAEEHRDLKVVLAAFLLVQARKGDPIRDGAAVAFHDDDHRDVGEAMVLLVRKDGRDLSPKLLLRVHDLLSLPAIARKNAELGFGKSARRPFLGRLPKAVTKWLTYREENPKLLDGLVKAGFRTTVIELARRVGYKPQSPRFFERLRWKQAQADDGRRTIAIGAAVSAAATWDGLDEAALCARIVLERPSWKRLVGLLPKGVGLTRAVMAAAIEAGSLSDKDLVIATPTLEELGLLEVADVRERWLTATRKAEDMRAANLAVRVSAKATREALSEAADTALKKAVEKVARGVRTYFFIDVSGSMQGAIEAAKRHLARFLQGFPVERTHVAIFNTQGREIRIPHASAAGVENAFRGITAGGGTDYGAGVRALAGYAASADEDPLFVFVGDEEASEFSEVVRASGLRPMAFGLVKVAGGRGDAVHATAARLGIPCFRIAEETFADAYAIPRTIRALVAATPVGTPQASHSARLALAEAILKTELLKKPTWAA